MGNGGKPAIKASVYKLYVQAVIKLPEAGYYNSYDPDSLI